VAAVVDHICNKYYTKKTGNRFTSLKMNLNTKQNTIQHPPNSPRMGNRKNLVYAKKGQFKSYEILSDSHLYDFPSMLSLAEH
jgi:hypothetical protein